VAKLRVALIGCGGISRSHATGYLAAADKVQVTHCVDPSPAHAAERAAALGGTPVAGYQDILSEVDAVDICTPHHLHYNAAKDALETGCHVLVEKPMANLRPECEHLAELAEQQDKRLMVGYVLRYMPAMQQLKEVIASGRYGAPIQIASSVEARVTGEHLPWAAKKEQLGGGVLFSHGCHTVDVMVSCCGPVARVAMLGNNENAAWMEGEGTAQVILQFASGVLGHHTSSWAMPHAHRIPTLRVWLSDGFLEVAGSNLVAYRGQEVETLYEPQPDEPAAMTRQIEHFVDCCLTGATPLTDGRTAIESLKVIWAAYQSRETGQVVVPG